MATQYGSQIGFEDVFRINNLSDADMFRMSLECGEFFGAGDIKVKVFPEDNRVLIEGEKVLRTGAVEMTRKVTYEHQLPKCVDTTRLNAGWDPNEDVLVIEAPVKLEIDVEE